MALIEVNLEKPALVEEYRYPGEATESEPSREQSHSESDSSGGSKAKVLGLLGVLAGIGLLVWKLKSRGESEQTEFDEFGEDERGEQEYEHGPEPEIGGESGSDESESGGAKGKVAGFLGLVVAAVGLAVAVQKRRN